MQEFTILLWFKKLQLSMVSWCYTVCSPYSPFLNPIEGFWSKLKADVECEILTKADSLTLCIIASVHQVTANACKG